MIKKRPLIFRVSNQEKLFFARQLALLLKSGISILDALNFLNKQTKSPSLKFVIENLIEDVSKGISLHTALRKFKSAFSEIFVNIIEVGEISGNLHQNLEYLANELQKQGELKNKIIASFIYPVFILLGTFAIMFLMIFIVFPKLMPVFLELKIELPLITKIFIKISTFLLNYWYLVIIFILFLILVFYLLFKFPQSRYFLDKILINFPFLGSIFKYSLFISFTRNTAILIKSGTDVVGAIAIASETIDNLFYQKIFNEIVNLLKEGHTLNELFYKKSKYFDDVFINLIEVGEKTGSLAENFFYLADYYQQLLDIKLRNFITILEPILLAAMGVIVAFISLAIITPIYQITQKIQFQK